MLNLVDVKKDYLSGDDTVHALKGVSLSFRKSEFVSILGPSGCGKTTLLNIIGGLDRYTSGDLIIDGISTKDYRDGDWDFYRNSRIGFVFQNYDLIPHLTILQNVELALTLSGVAAEERKERARRALEEVGLKEKLNKRPNQLSGGQMQRVSIARALVNDPDIILADEPTGALDSVTSVQIMELLTEIARKKLIVMVTHNAELAERYSTRIIRLLDGEVVGDTMPYGISREVRLESGKTGNRVDQCPHCGAINPIGSAVCPECGARKPRRDYVFKRRRQAAEKEAAALAATPKSLPAEQAASPRKSSRRKRGNKSKMNFATAMKLSFRNLLTKKVRTGATVVAGSIGIVGVALVLALSNGFTDYINKMERSTLSVFPIMISELSYDSQKLMQMSPIQMIGSQGDLPSHPDDGEVHIKEDTLGSGSSMEDYMQMFKDIVIVNDITDEYLDYVAKIDQSKASLFYMYNYRMNLLGKSQGGTVDIVDASTLGWQQLLGDAEFMESQYDVIEGRYPQNPFETVILVDRYNRVSGNILQSIGIDIEQETILLSDLIGETPLRLIDNDGFYVRQESGLFADPDRSSYESVYGGQYAHPIEIVGVLRIKEGLDFELMTGGIAYTAALTDYCYDVNAGSQIAAAQAADAETNLRTGDRFSKMTAMDLAMAMMGIQRTAEDRYHTALQEIGYEKTPIGVYVFAENFDNKTYVKQYLDKYNMIKVSQGKDSEQVVYTDMAETVTDMVQEIVRIISIVLVCFAAIALVVSSVMIGIITYVSVVERTKEIGILRALGARKIDISNVFNAETVIVGLCSGILGVVATYILSIPINLIIGSLSGIKESFAALHPFNALIMVALSVGLTVISGLIPAALAAKKDPVVALRSE